MKAILIAVPLLGAVAVLASRSGPKGEVEIARYETSLEGRTPNQQHNAVLAAREIDRSEVAPGAVFSFNARLKGWTVQDGYRKAPVSYNGTLIDSFGGGVCQTSSTLYNAALLAGCEIVTRHSHQFQPAYVPPGRDAAVAYESVDLAFRNGLPSAIKIRATTQGKRLIVRLLSSSPPRETPLVESEVLSRTMPQTFRIGSGPRQTVTNSGKPGFEVKVWRIWENRRELISSKSYPVMHRVVRFSN